MSLEDLAIPETTLEGAEGKKQIKQMLHLGLLISYACLYTTFLPLNETDLYLDIVLF